MKRMNKYYLGDILKWAGYEWEVTNIADKTIYCVGPVFWQFKIGDIEEGDIVMKSSPKDRLWNLCIRFRNKLDIHCSETIYQTDRVIESAYEFIEEVCEIVGYTDVDN